jgi:hypothetical protein
MRTLLELVLHYVHFPVESLPSTTSPLRQNTVGHPLFHPHDVSHLATTQISIRPTLQSTIVDSIITLVSQYNEYINSSRQSIISSGRFAIAKQSEVLAFHRKGFIK